MVDGLLMSNRGQLGHLFSLGQGVLVHRQSRVPLMQAVGMAVDPTCIGSGVESTPGH